MAVVDLVVVLATAVSQLDSIVQVVVGAGMHHTREKAEVLPKVEHQEGQVGLRVQECRLGKH